MTHAHSQRGAALVEMAAVTPFFILLVFGIIESARLCMVTQLLTTAAREGCRVAVTNNKTATDVTARVNSVLSGSGITHRTTVIPAVLHWVSDAQPGTKVGDTVTVIVSVPFESASWFPAPFFFFGGSRITAQAIMSSEHTQPLN